MGRRRVLLTVGVALAVVVAVTMMRGGPHALWLELTEGAHVRDLARAERIVRARITSAATNAGSSVAGGGAHVVQQASVDRIRALYAQGDALAKMARIAIASDDPVLWVRAFDWQMLCNSSRFAKPISVEQLQSMRLSAGHTRSGVTAEALVASTARAREMPPMRWAMSPAIVERLARVLSGRTGAPDTASKAYYDVMTAPLTEADRSARDRLIASTRAQCEAMSGDRSLVGDYFLARDRWQAQGATGAALHNPRAGWTSEQFSALSSRDFELVERIVRERQPDGLAQLLSFPGVYQLELLGAGDGHSTYSGMAAIEGKAIVAALASCELGVADCSANSPRFIEACTSAGGCHQPDIASLARYILARDGLDPTWFDRETARVVKAVYEGDLTALGVRRKLPDKP